MRLSLVLAAAALALAFAPGARAVFVEHPRPRLPSSPALERSLAALAGYEHALLALRPSRRAARLVAARDGVLVSPALRLWRVESRVARRLVPALARCRLLRYAEPDRPRAFQAHLTAGDPLLASAWHLQRVGADRAEPPGPGVPVTIVDTGTDLGHEEFAGRPDTVALNAQEIDASREGEEHGTATASVAAAPANGKGTVGVYPTAVLRVYDLGALNDSAIIAALEAARAAGPSVINLSLGGPEFSRALLEATLRAFDAGSLLVAAGGNEFLEENPTIYPGDFPHVLTVAATDKSDDPSEFSSSSTAVDIAAPGEAIPAAAPLALEPSGYLVFVGTSFSSPIVAAAAAWVWTARGASLDRTQVFDLLRFSARDIGAKGFDERTGFGLVDIPAALSDSIPPLDPQEPNDDVDQVKASGLLGKAKPLLTTAARGRTRLSARLDVDEDPDDVYRLYVRPGRTVEVIVRPVGDVGVILWSGRTASVFEKGEAADRDQLAGSNRPGASVERVAWTNASGRGVTVLLDVWIPEGAKDLNPEYRAVISTR